MNERATQNFELNRELARMPSHAECQRIIAEAHRMRDEVVREMFRRIFTFGRTTKRRPAHEAPAGGMPTGHPA
ncbi:MAG: hypothetical protein KDE35_02660 [Geminicoccaceae bacterium]|nr:hypothetical protein [Geminicoccaceae bacterium]